jgi:hypothetical protein
MLRDFLVVLILVLAFACGIDPYYGPVFTLIMTPLIAAIVGAYHEKGKR